MFIALSCRNVINNVLLRSVHRSVQTCKQLSTKPILDFNDIKHPTKVPLKPVTTEPIKSEPVKVDKETVELLMRLSLVNLSDE